VDLLSRRIVSKRGRKMERHLIRALTRQHSTFFRVPGASPRETHRRMRTIRSRVFPSVHRDMNSYESWSIGILYFSSREVFLSGFTTLTTFISSLLMMTDTANVPEDYTSKRAPYPSMRCVGGDNA